MAFDFLPDQKPPPPKPNTQQGEGSKFAVGKNVFYDDYLNHLDAHRLFSTPPANNEFKLTKNFDMAKIVFAKSKIEEGIQSDFFGAGTTFDKLIAGYTQFQDPELLEKTVQNLESEISMDLFSNIEKPKMLINDRFGMFSFDLASMAMTYVYEYFTKKGTKVDSNDVVKIKNDYIYTPTKEVVFQKIKKRDNGSPVVISSVRKSLIDFDKKNKKERSVEIIITNSVSYREKASDFVFNSMAGIAAAKSLILKGFKVKLTGLLVCKNEVTGTNYYHFVPVKNYNENLDINAAAYVCGDPRFFRYQGFKMFIAGNDRNNEITPDGIGVIIKDIYLIEKTIEKDYVSNSKLDQADTRLYFGNSRNMDQVKTELNTAIDLIQQKYGTKN